MQNGARQSYTSSVRCAADAAQYASVPTAEPHTVTFSKEGYASHSVEVPAGTQNSITVKMKAAAPGTCVSIFDGKTLTGWVPKPNAAAWTVNAADAAIMSSGSARGFVYTSNTYTSYRIMFSVRQLSGNHQPCVLFFGQYPDKDACGALQFQVPNGWSWDYRPGKNNSGGGLFTLIKRPNFNIKEWSRVEMLVNTSTGMAKFAAAQPLGSKAVEVLRFSDPACKSYPATPFAIQSHNSGIKDEYKDICIEVNPKDFEFITTK
jgi:hypothetical protein